MLRRWARLLPLLILVACTGSFDGDSLESRYPRLRDVGTDRLLEGTPYLWPANGELVYFLCRWTVDQPLSVALPDDATVAERGLLERAMRAWESAGLGVRFHPTTSREAVIVMRFRESDQPLAGTTGANCAVDPATMDAEVADAQLVFARITLRRTQHDFKGKAVALSNEELLGSAVHEMGHALGFQGHARRGATAMVRAVDEVKRVGRALLAGEPFRDDALRALYGVPSGVVVARSPLPAGRTAIVDDMLVLAEAQGLAGPFVRVGDRGLRLLWLDRAGRESYVVHGSGLPELLRQPDALTLTPDKRAAALLRSAR